MLIRLDGGLGLEGARATSRQRRLCPLPTKAGSGPKALPGSLSSAAPATASGRADIMACTVRDYYHLFTGAIGRGRDADTSIR